MLLSGSVVEVEIDFEMPFQLVKRRRWQTDFFMQGMLVWTTTSFAQNKHLSDAGKAIWGVVPFVSA